MDNYPWYFRFVKYVNLHHKAIKKVVSIIRCKESTDKTKVMMIKMLLVSLEEELSEADRDLLSIEFNYMEDETLQVQDKFQAGSVSCRLFLN